RNRQQGRGRDVPGKVAAGDELHRDVARVFADHRVEDGDDVGMAQLAGERGFLEELRAVDRADLRVDRLQRDFLAGEGVLREVNRAGGSLAEKLLHVVLPDLEPQVQGFGKV